MGFFKDLFEKLTSQLVGALSKIAPEAMGEVFSVFKPLVLTDIKNDIALASIDEEKFLTKDMKDSVKNLKEKWATSPKNFADISHDIMEIVIGKASKVQLEAISGIHIDSKLTLTNRLFDQIAIVTDIAVLGNILSTIGSAIPTCNLQYMGENIKSYLDYSGLSQVVGFGYGSILSGVLSEPLRNEIYSKTTPLPLDLQTAIRMYYRGEIPQEGLDKELGRLGFDAKRRQILIDSFKYVPGAADIITFGRRDIFSPDTVEFFGYDKNIPTLPKGMLQAAGMDKKQFEYFWRAHWRDIEFRTSALLLHRGIINDEEFDVMLRAANYPPNVVEKLKAITYNLYTRVDIRRLFKMGIVALDDVYQNYRGLGYDHEHAVNLTEFTRLDSMSNERDLSRAQVEKAFEEGIYSDKELKEAYNSLGYDSVESDVLGALLNAKISDKAEREHIETLTLQFQLNQLTPAELEKELQTLEMPVKKVEYYITQALRKKANSLKLPPTSKLEKWFKKKIISDKEFKNLMAGHGYGTKIIDDWLAEIKG